MTEQVLVYFTSQAMLLILYLSLPVIIAATVVGLVIGLFQALTQIQEQTLPFGIKLVAAVLALMLTARWIGGEIMAYATRLFDVIPTVH